MLEILGPRQKELLQLLLKNKAGMTADELCERLNITRTAVRQHLAALENDRLVGKGATRPSGGRPEQLYVLTTEGQELFPRHYAWFAELLMESIREEFGTEGLGARLEAMGERVATQLRQQYSGLTTPEQKVQKLAEIMEQLGYDAQKLDRTDGSLVIEASNCIFHNLAIRNAEVCKFDLALLSNFTGCKVDSNECIVTGGNVCRFRFRE
ncbi:MAG TPA: HTH domain-containing protein [Burkholderiaceae bacterium]|nr:HTH domain-containing protein [Burkholderiaceae bacterium]